MIFFVGIKIVETSDNLKLIFSFNVKFTFWIILASTIISAFSRVSTTKYNFSFSFPFSAFIISLLFIEVKDLSRLLRGVFSSKEAYKNPGTWWILGIDVISKNPPFEICSWKSDK